MPPWWVTSSLLDDVVHGYDVFRGNVGQDVVDLPEHPSAAPAEDAGLLADLARHLVGASLGQNGLGITTLYQRVSREKGFSLPLQSLADNAGSNISPEFRRLQFNAVSEVVETIYRSDVAPKDLARGGVVPFHFIGTIGQS